MKKYLNDKTNCYLKKFGWKCCYLFINIINYVELNESTKMSHDVIESHCQSNFIREKIVIYYVM